ncbi:hypothetical protein GC173_13185 [bacterium]|nr:hypothetical protein [bacterium]
MEDLREKVARKLAANPAIKTGMLADALGISEAEVLRAMPAGYAHELAVADMAAFVTGLEKLGLVYFVTRNDACVTEIKGRFGGFSKSGPFFNVSSEALHLHLRLDRVAAVFHITPPSTDGKPAWPSLQFFQTSGEVAFKVFLIESMQREVGDNWEQSLAALDELVCAHRS